jgi:hypothetical protein
LSLLFQRLLYMVRHNWKGKSWLLTGLALFLY